MGDESCLTIRLGRKCWDTGVSRKVGHGETGLAGAKANSGSPVRAGEARTESFAQWSPGLLLTLASGDLETEGATKPTGSWTPH